MTASASKIAKTAMTLANSFLADATDAVLREAKGDLQALFEAAQLVRLQATATGEAHSAEHLAFSLITAAYAALRERPAPTAERKRPRPTRRP